MPAGANTARRRGWNGQPDDPLEPLGVAVSVPLDLVTEVDRDHVVLHAGQPPITVWLPEAVLRLDPVDGMARDVELTPGCQMLDRGFLAAFRFTHSFSGRALWQPSGQGKLLTAGWTSRLLREYLWMVRGNQDALNQGWLPFHLLIAWHCHRLPLQEGWLRVNEPGLSPHLDKSTSTLARRDETDRESCYEPPNFVASV